MNKRIALFLTFSAKKRKSNSFSQMKINVQLTICIFDEHFFYLAVYVLYVGHRQSKDQLNSNRKEEEKKAKLNKHVN